MSNVLEPGDSLIDQPTIGQNGTVAPTSSRRTRRVIRANIALALGIKAVVFALAVAGIASLWMAIVADVGASLLVILNGMWLRAG